MDSRALEDISVLDLGQLYNGPYCSLLLSFLGAEVIKVEPPGGEPVRSRSDEGEPPEVVMLNSNKHGISIDLKSEQGKDLFKDLIRETDVLVENFTVGTMDRLGLGYDVLSEINPQLVYAHGSGFGEEGPYQRYPAMDLTVQAIGGAMDVTGFPENPPVKAGIAAGDFLGGVHLAAGVLAALYQREITGEGQFVEVSMHDALYPTLTSPLGAHYKNDDVPPRTGNRHGGLSQTPYNVYEVADGYVALLALTDDHWRGILEVIGREDLIGDARFESNVKRTENMEAVDELLQENVEERRRENLVEELLDASVPCAPVKEIDEVADDPHLKERGMINEIDHPEFGPIAVPGLPIRLSNSESPDIEPSPTLGRDTEAVLRNRLGLSEDELGRLKEDDVI